MCGVAKYSDPDLLWRVSRIARREVRGGYYANAVLCLLIVIGEALLFTCIQVVEYLLAPFDIN